MKTNEQESGESIAGTNLTTIAEYAKTALAMADLRSRYSGLVFELDSPAKIKEAKKNVAEVRGYRTALEDERKRIKQPALDRCRLIDDEAKRLTAELRELEDPMKAQIDAKEAEIEAERIRVAQAEQDRVDGHRAAIQRMRDFPLSLQGKPSEIMRSRLAEFELLSGTIDQMEEFRNEGCDAFNAACAAARDLITRQMDHEAEQEKIRQERAELERMRAENERLQREAQERIEADARKAREEAEAALRAEQAERDRIAAEERAERERIEAEQRAAREAEEAAERARLAEVAKAQREQQEKLDRERREHEAQMERDRVANLSLIEAARAVVRYFGADNGKNMPQCVHDLAMVLQPINDSENHPAASEKRSAAKPVKRKVQ